MYQIYISYLYLYLHNSILETGCYISATNIIYFGFYNNNLENKSKNKLKKIAYLLINSIVIGILDASWKFIFFSNSEVIFIYKHHKFCLYNIFLSIIYRLYPSTFFEGISVSHDNLYNWLNFYFVGLKFKRYNLKKRVLLFTEKHINIENTRFRKILIILVLKDLNFVLEAV